MYIFIKTEAIGFTKIEVRISFKGSTLIFVADPVEEMSFFSFKTIVNAITKEGSAVGANNDASAQHTEVSDDKESEKIEPKNFSNGNPGKNPIGHNYISDTNIIQNYNTYS